MQARFVFLLGVGLLGGMALLCAPLSAKDADQNIGLSVVELFTSQGCSSCPPADALLKVYAERADVVALSYSVDYWNYIGWHDTFSRPEHSKRQRDYARSMRRRSVYTPQVVINGVVDVNGADKGAIETGLQRTVRMLAGQRYVLVVQDVAGQLMVALDRPLKLVDQSAVLWMLRVRKKAKVQIKKGENRGRLLVYYNVVLGQKKVAMLQNGQDVVRFRKPKPPLMAGEQFVLLLQVGETGAVLGALEL